MAYSREASSDSSEGLAAEGPCFLAQIVLRQAKVDLRDSDLSLPR